MNRHDYSPAEVDQSLERPVVRRLLDLIRLRATHPAFAGRLEVTSPAPGTLRMLRVAGFTSCELVVDLASGRFTVHAGREQIS